MILIRANGIMKEKFMSYNPKNKNVVILALTFAVMMIISKAGKAEDAAPFLFDEQANAVANEVTEAVKDNTTQALIAAEEATEKTVEALQDTTQTVAADIDVAAENIKKATDTLQEDLLFAEKIGDEQKELLSEEKAKLQEQYMQMQMAKNQIPQFVKDMK
jgi:flagellar motility protein MotE (MotC chaperone)